METKEVIKQGMINRLSPLAKAQLDLHAEAVLDCLARLYLAGAGNSVLRELEGEFMAHLEDTTIGPAE